ncbi:MAG: hypothetical protein R2706_15360 [Acidimicrobiales bacterium]
MTPADILTLFDDLTSQLVDRLDSLADWGWSGGRSDQYQHDVVADDLFVPQLVAAGLRVLTEESGLSGSATSRWLSILSTDRPTRRRVCRGTPPACVRLTLTGRS